MRLSNALLEAFKTGKERILNNTPADFKACPDHGRHGRNGPPGGPFGANGAAEPAAAPAPSIAAENPGGVQGGMPLNCRRDVDIAVKLPTSPV